MDNKNAAQVLSLQELLSKKSVLVLRDIAKKSNLIGYSGLKKEKLIERILPALTDPNRLSSLLYVADSALWQLLLQAYSADSPSIVPSKISSPCKVIADLGYLQWMECEIESSILMPPEIKDVFRQMLDEGFAEKKERADLLDAYAMSATSLYGVISQDDFVTLFNKQNDVPTDIDEVFSVLIQHISADAPYSFWDEYLVHFLFEENEFQDVRNLLTISSGKLRYIPEKEIFLRYADPDYVEQTPALLRLREFLEPYTVNMETSIDEIISEISFSCTVDASLEHALSVLKSYNFQISRDKAKTTAQLIIDLSNNTRKWANRGHTPNEIHQFFASLSTSGKRKKIGRNEPCPCGSGKKYKKCCGR